MEHINQNTVKKYKKGEIYYNKWFDLIKYKRNYTESLFNYECRFVSFKWCINCLLPLNIIKCPCCKGSQCYICNSLDGCGSFYCYTCTVMVFNNCYKCNIDA